jgi:hypothetical protein
MQPVTGMSLAEYRHPPGFSLQKDDYFFSRVNDSEELMAGFFLQSTVYGWFLPAEHSIWLVSPSRAVVKNLSLKNGWLVFPIRGVDWFLPLTEG